MQVLRWPQRILPWLAALFPGCWNVQASPIEPTKETGGGSALLLPTGADPAFRRHMLDWDAPVSRRPDRPQPLAIDGHRPRTSSLFGFRHDPFTGVGKMHAGIDIPGRVAAPIFATGDGYVERAGWAAGYGNLIALYHGNGVETRYGHLARILLVAGEKVHRGQLIGLMGSTGRSTGTHLHYEIRIAGRPVDPFAYRALSANMRAAGASDDALPLVSNFARTRQERATDAVRHVTDRRVAP